jgi:glycosyltransferase involved in cell wall biosynthesis
VRILGFGTYDVTRHPRIGIVLDGFRAHGDEVVEANRPVGFSTAERVAMLRQPWRAWKLVPRLARGWVSIVRQARRSGDASSWDAVVVGYLGHFDVILARIVFPRATIVLDLMVFAADTARDRGFDTGGRVRLLEMLDSVAVRCATVVMVDTDEHASALPAKDRSKAVVVPIGAAAEWFAARPARVATGDAAGSAAKRPLRVVFFGLFTPLQGAPTIGEAISRIDESEPIEFTMIGSGQDLDATRRLVGLRRAVTWREWVEPDLLPAMVAAHDLCLGIFGTGPKALRVVPNKVFEGAAAGCTIVTSDTVPQRRLLGASARYVPPGDPVALAEALCELAHDRGRVEALAREVGRLASNAFGGSEVVQPLRRRLVDRSADSGSDPFPVQGQ